MEPEGCAGGGGGMDGCEECVALRQHLYWSHPAGGRRQFIVRTDYGFEDTLCIPPDVSSQLRNMIPHSEPIKLEAPDGRMYDVEFDKFGVIYLTTGWRKFVDANHIQEGDSILFVYRGGSIFENKWCLILQMLRRSTTDFRYTMFPGTFLTEAQEEKVLELAHGSMSSQIPLHVAALNKENGSEDCYVGIPLRLLDNFKEGMAIQLKAHGNKTIYSVGASKHGDEQIILQSGLRCFAASHRIQKNVDILVFRSKGKARLEVFVLDPSGCERTPCSGMGNSSDAREMREDSVEIVDQKPPPPPTVVDVSSGEDEIVGKDTTTSRREQRLVRGCRAKARKMASTSSPCNKPEYKGDTSNEESSLEAPVPNNPESRYMLPKGTILNGQQEDKIKEKVRAIGSEFPVFVKVMTAHSVCWKA